MPKRARKPLDPVCGRLAQAKSFGQTDFCGLPHGHQGDHIGKYAGLRWRDNPAGRGKKPIMVPRHGNVGGE